MELIDYIRQQFSEEMETTRKMLRVVPMDKPTWKPHAKSMELAHLVVHIADLPSWPEMTLRTDELDFENNTHHIPEVKTHEELMALFEKSARLGIESLTDDSAKLFEREWTLRSGKTIYSKGPKIDVIRMAMSQIIHHRAQLGVYLRLLEIPIPGSYGPSADDQSF